VIEQPLNDGQKFWKKLCFVLLPRGTQQEVESLKKIKFIFLCHPNHHAQLLPSVIVMTSK